MPRDATAGDVRQPVHAPEHRRDARHVAPVDREQDVGDGAEVAEAIVYPEPEAVEDDPPSERVAVGVQAGGRVREEHVARGDAIAVERLVLLHDADDGAGKIEVAGLIEPGHLGGLAAGERHPVGPAAARNPFDDAGQLRRPEPGTGDIVHERDRPRRMNQDVVHAVVDEILADGVEPRLPGWRPAPWCRPRRC